MIVDLGEEPSNKHATFTVLASIYSEKANNYIHHWVGGIFDNYDDAYDFWDQWEPPKEDLVKVMDNARQNGDNSHHELEIQIRSNDPNENRELAFMNTTIDELYERN